MFFPEEDWTLSPYTGWTRDHWAAVADQWVRAALPYAAPDHATIALPGRPADAGAREDSLEGFSRTFLLAAASGCPGFLAGWYAKGLQAGPGVWERAVDVGADDFGLQTSICPIVEAANIALALDLSRAQVWEGLPSSARERLADWLAHHARLAVFDNNWRLFPAMCEAFLHSVGYDVSGMPGAGHVAEVESYYLGDGWYNDGPDGRTIDYYGAWAIHPFLGAWYRLRDPSGLEGWRSRLAAFVSSYAATFAPSGDPMIQGRSLTYRTAVLAPLWLAAIEGCSPLPPGAVRRHASATLRYFVSSGVRGPLSLGWHGPECLSLVQPYSGPASPYFAGLGFLGLTLPVSHPVWTSVEEEPPLPSQRPIPAAGWLVHGDREVVRLVNHGSDRAYHQGRWSPDRDQDPLYTRFAYSTHTAPLTSADREDNHFALVTPDGLASRRARIGGRVVSGRFAASWHTPRRDGEPWPARVVTASILLGEWEVRAHLVTGDGGPYTVRETGHALAGGDTATGVMAEGPTCLLRPDGLRHRLLAVSGWSGEGITWHSEATLYGPAAAVPFLSGRWEKDGDGVYVALHHLGYELPDPPRVTVRGTLVHAGEIEIDLAGIFDDPV